MSQITRANKKARHSSLVPNYISKRINICSRYRNMTTTVYANDYKKIALFLNCQTANLYSSIFMSLVLDAISCTSPPKSHQRMKITNGFRFIAKQNIVVSCKENQNHIHRSNSALGFSVVLLLYNILGEMFCYMKVVIEITT